MKIANLCISTFLLSIATTLFSQSKTIQISIVPRFEQEIVNLNDSTLLSNDYGTIKIEVLKFYISNIEFLKGGHVVLQEKNSFHLIDASDKKTWNISIENQQNITYDEVRYCFGIDSVTNSGGALGGDLDPMKGMYWAWQSGYINFKLEGKSPACKTRNNEFTFHLGGFLNPFYAMQKISFLINNKEEITIHLDIAQVIKKIDLSRQNHIMSPSDEAINISKIVASSFKIEDN